MLGVNFDVGLLMYDELKMLVAAISWKSATLLRSRRFFDVAQLVNLWKANVLSFAECRTAAIYHAADSHLKSLDHTQTHFLKELGLDDDIGLLCFNLAPLQTRRDIAMLGLIQRSVLGLGPAHFQQFFKLAANRTERFTRRRSDLHKWQLVDERNNMLEIGRRSALGLISIYNMLPQSIVESRTVAAFQSGLQEMVKAEALSGNVMWRQTLSPRLSLLTHPLELLRQKRSALAR